MRRVPSSIPFVVCCLLSIGAVCSEPLAAQQPPSRSEPGIAPVGTVSLNGTISDAANHQGLDGVIVELDSSSGGAIGTAITSGNGAFHFENLTTGTYTLVVDQVGFQTVNERVVVLDSPLYGIQIELLRASEAGTATNKGPASVSVRELSIPRRAHAQMEKGLALLYGKSDYQGSLRPFEEAIQQYPNYYEAYAQIGVAYMKLTDTVNSEKAFRKSIEVSHEQYEDAYIGLTNLFLNGQRFADAEPLARKAVEIDSTSWQAHSQLARALLELHRPSEAETSALAAVNLKPDNETLYLVLANVHIRLHNNRALLDDLNHYLKLAPKGPFAQQARRQRDEIQKLLAAPESAPAKSPPPEP
jgi:Tfp pilus assembly protein PilF